MGLYIVPEFQRKGLGTRLLKQTKQALASTGVTDLTMRVMSDSEPQVRLVQRFRAELVELTSGVPSMQIYEGRGDCPLGWLRGVRFCDIMVMLQGESPLRRRPKGFPIALWKPSGCTTMFLELSWCLRETKGTLTI